MKTSKTFLPGKTLALTALLMVFSFGLFAAPGKGKKDVKKEKNDITRTLSVDEAALYDSVEDFYQENYTNTIQKTVKIETVSKVIVYDMAGNVLQEQSAEAINLAKLPTNAKLLMKENGVHYYVVL